jgi:hypothetical protein
MSGKLQAEPVFLTVWSMDYLPQNHAEIPELYSSLPEPEFFTVNPSNVVCILNVYSAIPGLIKFENH